MRKLARLQTEELWKIIPEFTMYEISNKGQVRNVKHDRLMHTSLTSFGHVKITLTNSWNGQRFTRSVAQLVAEAFVEQPTVLCDQVVVLDGDFENVCSDNLVWRPRWYAWKYTRQLKMAQPLHYRNLPVINTVTGTRHTSIVAAGMKEGLLFNDIWKSTYTGQRIFPYKDIFEIVEYGV